jgi:uncharacterized protein DUF3999
MANILQIILIAALFASPLTYFKYHRPVQPAQSRQQYLAVDESIWQHARRDLGDLRLYNGANEVPYSLVVERGGAEQEEKALPIFQQARVAGKTQFMIDMRDLAEYDHVALKLSTQNFVAHAQVEGQDELHGKSWAGLGDSILYDLSKEHLGSNTTLRLPRASYKYLRVTVDGPVKPDEVIGAMSELRQERKPVWRTVGSQPTTGSTNGSQVRWEKGKLQPQEGRDTLLTFNLPEGVPAEKISFDIDPAQGNFWRRIEILNDRGQLMGSGEIERIHMQHAGQKIDSDEHEVSFSARRSKVLAAIIYNGDDPPLKLNGAHLEQEERRLYFDAPSGATLTLYYGDEKLIAPVYDYARFFQAQPSAIAAQLGTEQQNASYSERPDERPWSERHPAVLWAAILAAVLVLGALALRSMRSAAQ